MDTIVLQKLAKIQPTQQGQYDVDKAIAQWLTAKAGRSGSKQTAWFDDGALQWRGKYAEYIFAYRSWCNALGIDLDCEDGRQLAEIARAWAAHGKRTGTVAGATYNQRLSILSSFFDNAVEQKLIPDGNPILSYCKSSRRKTFKYQGAAAVPNLAELVAAIDKSGIDGARDYALIMLGIYTGLRASELAGLRYGDVQFFGDTVSILVRRLKGGKAKTLVLPTAAANALKSYLEALDTSANGDSALWVSVSPRNYGSPITTQAIGDICLKHLGASKVHALRHSFAALMIDAGAPLQNLQGALGHNDLSTTSHYVRSLSRNDNPFAEKFNVGIQK